MVQDTNMLWSMLKLLLALPVVILLAYISLRLTNKYLYQKNQGKNIQVLERTPINNKSSLCVVKIGNEYMVLGVSENNFQVVKTLKKEEALQYTSQNESLNFTEALSMNLKKWKKENHNHE